MSDFPTTIKHLCRNGHDFTVRQLNLILLLQEHRDPALEEHRLTRSLAVQMNVAKPVVTRCADRLEDAGFLKRATPLYDRRLCVLTLTASGEAFAKKLREGFEQRAVRKAA